MLLSSWLRTKTPRPAPAARVRPRLEALDGRDVPSTLHVTNVSDNAYQKGSLRYELAHTSASGKDTIDFHVAGQINLSSELLITKGVTIKGPGAGVVTLTTNYNWGDPWGTEFPRALEVNADKPVVISGVTITDNVVGSSSGPMGGGAVYNHSTLTMSNCDLSDNGADNGGAVYNAGTMTLTNCTLKDDRANYGGAIYNAGTMTVAGCTLSYDYGFGSFGSGGGSIYNTGTLAVGTSTFVWSDNIVGPYTDLGGNLFVTDRPQIGSFTASASTVSAGDSLTLTASNITDANPNSGITQVLIYGPNSIGGTPIGYATQTSPGVWAFTFSTAGMAAGTYTFYGQAVDSYGTSSLPASVTVQVV
jgi:hypothetical protein